MCTRTETNAQKPITCTSTITYKRKSEKILRPQERKSEKESQITKNTQETCGTTVPRPTSTDHSMILFTRKAHFYRIIY